MTTCVFAYTGASQQWTVPAGVTSATFDVIGAQGGTGDPIASIAGGLGGEATATVPVTPGATLQINVGGAGGAGTFAGQGDIAGTGGFNGGAVGGGAALSGGGGASDVRGGAFALGDRIIIAGGGGGSGGRTRAGGGGRTRAGGGGSGGGLAGTDGVDTTDATGLGGDGGTTVGGAGGAGSPSNGADGTEGGGGAAGSGTGATNTTGGGGGGGGGYRGGGGGGAGPEGGAGGGGGSGFGSAGTVFQTGVRAGNGLVTISYAEPADLGLSIGASPNPVKRGRTVTYTLTVKNFGLGSAPGVVVTDVLPSGGQFVSVQTSQGSCTAPAVGQTGTVTCTQGSLAIDATSTVQIVAKIVAPKKSTAINTASVTTTGVDSNPANNSATASVVVK